jgi:hypothetical protein
MLIEILALEGNADQTWTKGEFIFNMDRQRIFCIRLRLQVNGRLSYGFMKSSDVMSLYFETGVVSEFMSWYTPRIRGSLQTLFGNRLISLEV